MTLFKVKHDKDALREVSPEQIGDKGATTVSGAVICIKSPFYKGDAGIRVKV